MPLPETHGASIQKYFVRDMNCNFPQKIKYGNHCKYELKSAKNLFSVNAFWCFYIHILNFIKSFFKSKDCSQNMIFFSQ